MKFWRPPFLALLGYLILFFAFPSGADPLDNWTWRYPNPQGNTLNAVVYGNAGFVAVGTNGAIISSVDGTNWVVRSSGQFPTLYGVGYTEGIYVAVGAGGTILVSSNGATWSQQSSPTSNTLRGVAGNTDYSSGPAKFVAVGDTAAVVTSSDAVTWTLRTNTRTNSLKTVFYGNGTFTGLGDGGALMRGITTFPVNLIAGATNFYRAGVYNNGYYTYGGSVQAAGNNYASILNNSFTGPAISPNAWCSSSWFTISGLAVGNGLYVGVGYTAFTLEYSYPGIITTSPDGTNWTATPYTASQNSLHGVTYGNGLFVAVGNAGSIVVSSDGASWTDVSGWNRTAITALAGNDHLCIASGVGFNHFYSLNFPNFTTLVTSNGTNWSVSSTNLPPMIDLLASGNLFVGVNGGTVYTTTDGYNWTNSHISSNNLFGIGYGGGRYFVAGDNCAIFTSTNGVNWSDCSLLTSGTFSSAAYGNGLFVAAGSVVAVSTNGVSWSLKSNPPAAIDKIIFANGYFVASAGSALYSSVDGASWQFNYATTNLPSNPFSRMGLAYQNGEYLAISGVNPLKSLNGVDWSPATNTLPWLVGDLYDYYRVQFYSGVYRSGLAPVVIGWKGHFLIAGEDGILMQSDVTTVPVLTNTPHLNHSGFAFSFNPTPGNPFRVQASTNLVTWSDAFTGTATNSTMEFTDTNSAAYPARFFRVISP